MHEPPTNGLASCGVSARRKFCGNLKVCRPSELLRSPARTPSRQPLAVMRATFERKRNYQRKTNYNMSRIKNTFGALVTGIFLIVGSLEAKAQTNNTGNVIVLEESEQLNVETPWGNFLKEELGIITNKNTEKTIQNYLGKLQDILQNEIKEFLKINKALFPDQENLMYALGNLLHFMAREQFIDEEGINIANKIVENVNYTQDEENLDKIDESIETLQREFGKNPEVALAIFENNYNNAKNPAQKERIGKDLDELKTNYQNLLIQREKTQIQREKTQNATEREEKSRREAFEKSLDLYKRYKKDPKPGMEEVLFKVIDNFKKLDSEDLSPEIEEMIKDMDNIKAAKK